MLPACDIRAKLFDSQEIAFVNQAINIYSEEINAYTREIVARSEEINAYTKEIVAYTEEINARSEEMASYSEEIAAYSEEMIAYIEEIVTYSQEINAYIEEINSYTREMPFVTRSKPAYSESLPDYNSSFIPKTKKREVNNKKMNSRNESKLNMYRAVEQYGDENAIIVSSNLAFSDAFNRFKANIAAIAAAAQQNDTVLTGIAEDKNVLKQALARRAADIAGVIYAYAVGTSNNTLKQEVNFSYTALAKSKDNEIAPRCQNIHDKAVANLTDLADYGITAAALTSLQVAIDDYLAQSPKPRAATSRRKTTTGNLSELFKETDTLLRDELDRLVVTLKSAHPDFVNTYESNRIIVDPPTRTTQAKETITNNAENPS